MAFRGVRASEGGPTRRFTWATAAACVERTKMNPVVSDFGPFHGRAPRWPTAASAPERSAAGMVGYSFYRRRRHPRPGDTHRLRPAYIYQRSHAQLDCHRSCTVNSRRCDYPVLLRITSRRRIRTRPAPCPPRSPLRSLVSSVWCSLLHRSAQARPLLLPLLVFGFLLVWSFRSRGASNDVLRASVRRT